MLEQIIFLLISIHCIYYYLFLTLKALKLLFRILEMLRAFYSHI